MKKRASAIFFTAVQIGLMVLFPFAADAATFSIPEKKSDATVVPINASSYASLLLLDPSSGKVLYESNADKTWVPASLTKMMTCTVFDSTPTNWNAKASILKQDEVGGGRLQVPSGSVMTLKDILFSAIVGSANNAAMALGRLFDGKGMSAFIQKMNAASESYGLAKTSFHDAAGMDPKNTTSAYDVASLMIISERTDVVRQAMTTAHYLFTTSHPVIKKDIKNTNDILLNDSDIIVTGGKTGFIYESKYNLAVRAYPKGEPAKELLVVVLGANTRESSFTAARSLLRWGWSNFTWNASVSAGFRQNLAKGDRGSDVQALQKYLNTHGYPVAKTGAGSSGRETQLFGDATKAALIRFQQAHAKDILASHDATKASGYLDVYTRGYLNKPLGN
ncbi:MAG: peptidoglycan-binding protein [Patescibacteria group bacterium]